MGLAYGGNAWSQAAAASASTGLEEIVVTATRHSESLSKVPISVTALDQNALTTRGIKDFQDIAHPHPACPSTPLERMRSLSAAVMIRRRRHYRIYLDDTPIQMRAVGFNPDDTLPQISISNASRYCAAHRARCSARAPKAAPCALHPDRTSHAGLEHVFSQRSVCELGWRPRLEVGLAHGAALIDGTLGVRGSAWYRGDGGWVDRFDWATGTVTEENANYADTCTC